MVVFGRWKRRSSGYRRLPCAGSPPPSPGNHAGGERGSPRGRGSRPIPRCVAARLATVPRPRMMKGKPLLTPLQKTNPHTAMPRGLPSRRTAIMLKKDHGRICSRRSSPGAKSPTPLRDAFESLPPAHSLLVQLNHTDPTSPRFPLVSLTGSLLPLSGCTRLGPPGSEKLAPIQPPPTGRGQIRSDCQNR
jgi:hypothetical protein